MVGYTNESPDSLPLRVIHHRIYPGSEVSDLVKDSEVKYYLGEIGHHCSTASSNDLYMRGCILMHESWSLRFT